MIGSRIYFVWCDDAYPLVDRVSVIQYEEAHSLWRCLLAYIQTCITQSIKILFRGKV